MLTTHRHSVARTYSVCSAQCTQEQPVEYCLSACHCDCISFITNSIFCTWSYYQIEFSGRLFWRQHDSVRQQRWYGIQYISFWSLSAFPIFRGIVFGASNALLSLSVPCLEVRKILFERPHCRQALNHLTTLCCVNWSVVKCVVQHARWWEPNKWQPNTDYAVEFE